MGLKRRGPDKQNRRLVEHQIKAINKVLEPKGQELLLENVTEDTADLKWQRPLDKNHVIEEHVFGGEWFELFVTLNGIEYGIRMEREQV